MQFLFGVCRPIPTLRMRPVGAAKILYNTGMELISYNRTAWDRQVEKGIIWSIPVTSRQIQAARQGNWQIVLTPVKPVPATWFPSALAGSDVLCLASAGGQQGPILGGQMAAGLAVVDMYEDIRPEDPVSAFMPLFMVTKAVRLA